MDEVELIIWGPAEKLTASDAEYRASIKELLNIGIDIVVCKGYAEDWKITDSY